MASAVPATVVFLFWDPVRLLCRCQSHGFVRVPSVKEVAMGIAGYSTITFFFVATKEKMGEEVTAKGVVDADDASQHPACCTIDSWRSRYVEWVVRDVSSPVVPGTIIPVLNESVFE